MTFGQDIASGLRGAARLIVGIVPAGLAEAPETSVRRSFMAPLLCLPAAALIRWTDWHQQGVRPPLWHAAAVDFLLYAICWAGFLLLCRPLLAALGERRAWKRLILAWNWSSVAQYAVVLLAALFEIVPLGAFAARVAILVSLFWQTWIEWRALRAIAGSAWQTAILVGLDVVLSLVSQSLTVSLGG